ncbi:MAG: flavin reductase [Caldilineaceae bacterium]|nr:flavin reductase [Caldilineaceae bacterium]
MIYAVDSLAEQDRKNLLSDAIGLRPPAWVSVLDRSSQFYLASFPFVTAVCIDPMTILFPVNNAEDTAETLVLRAIAATGEFVINFPTQAAIAALNFPAMAVPIDQGNADWAAFTTRSQSIRPPRLTDVALAFECRLHQVMKMGLGPGGTSVIFGDVKSIYQQE